MIKRWFLNFSPPPIFFPSLHRSRRIRARKITEKRKKIGGKISKFLLLCPTIEPRYAYIRTYQCAAGMNLESTTYGTYKQTAKNHTNQLDGRTDEEEIVERNKTMDSVCYFLNLATGQYWIIHPHFLPSVQLRVCRKSRSQRLQRNSDEQTVLECV